MNLKQKLNEVMERCGSSLKETTPEMMKLIKDDGLVTGSYAWGVESEDSDIDIVLPSFVDIDFNDAIFEHNGVYLHAVTEDDMHYFQDGFKSCYVISEGKIYNLLFTLDEKTYNKWIIATNIMIKDCMNSSLFKERIKDKKFRVEYFEMLKREN